MTGGGSEGHGQELALDIYDSGTWHVDSRQVNDVKREAVEEQVESAERTKRLKSESARESRRKTVLAFLEAASEPIVRTNIVSRTGLNDKNTMSTLEQLMDEGLVCASTEKVAGRSRTTYSLKNEFDEPRASNNSLFSN